MSMSDYIIEIEEKIYDVYVEELHFEKDEQHQDQSSKDVEDQENENCIDSSYDDYIEQRADIAYGDTNFEDMW